MNQLKEYSAYVEAQTLKFQFPDQPANLYDPLRYFLTLGGKRMRPILTLMSGQLFDVSKETALPAALAIELFHNFSLIHDDIMDQAPVRRGQPTVHEKWDANHGILSGDVLLVKAYQQLAHYPPQQLSELFNRFNQTAIEVCEGQQMDMDFEKRTDVSEAEYIEMIRLKTSVLLGCALEFGAILGNQGTVERAHLYEFGVDLGIAFQIQDDLLDLYADPLKFGKQVGGDILSNKKTLLLLTALHTKDTRVQSLLEMEPNAAKIETAKALFLELKVVAKVEAEMNLYYQKAMTALSQLSMEKSKVLPLIELADFLLNREH
jgi:geranylgeranyl diphosphate synthase type II